MRTMHLFAGIGGGLLADLILGHTPIVAVEWEPYACKVLRERAADGWFPDLHVWEGDVRLFDPSEYAGRVDCIHAGFPCQDISVAGKQAGLGEGTRSGLYQEVLRIAGVVRPKQLFLENVSAILSNGLGTVLGDLAALGYDARWLCIRASDVGSNHGRDRWFAIASNAFSPSVESVDIQKSFGANSQESRRWQFARAIDAGIPADDYPAFRRAVDDVPGQLDEIFGRLKGIGNAQVPLQAAAAYRLLGGA
jgi:DNA (cytosine-5)-methyltransferase 1